LSCCLNVSSDDCEVSVVGRLTMLGMVSY